MKTINLDNMTAINGGGSVVGNVINGACGAGAGWTLAASLKLVAAVAVPTGVGNVLAAVCLTNFVGTAAGWW
ncbi:hypothetical protein FVB9288_02647 [Flavobacterium sp. CECT 9288]|jgi:hypothetical protein|uniref:hypothetical protein n=1 Tax=Flavobacterium sp. CECT 9288 TaxID=2845819 RepID=UPI001E633F53|nr:hypothetical protein [Flavobacterium sp. CECT 9288]CAH0336917.1 hypothetical protein FVB9288_02647 [Flavobacterium sp. CECT 9288]